MEFFGLDIGSNSLKIIQLEQRQGKYYLLAFGLVPAPPKGLISDSESDLTTLSLAIKQLHSELKIKTKNVVSAISQDQVFTRTATFPQLSEEELESALKWEAEQYIPVPLNEVTRTHQVVGRLEEDGRQKLEVLLAAAPTRLVEKITKVLNVAGFEPLSLEMEMIAMGRSLVPPKSPPTMVVDLGAKATDIAVVENGQVVLAHSIPTAGEALTRAVELELGLESSQAEAYKKAYGADPGRLEGKIGGAIQPILAVIVEGMEKAIQFYRTRQKNITQVVISGGTAGLPEVASILAKKLNLEIKIGNPFAQIVEDGLVNKIPVQDIPRYSVAVGLAMKEMK
jgi:type IV pilus assembly protein PilM